MLSLAQLFKAPKPINRIDGDKIDGDTLASVPPDQLDSRPWKQTPKYFTKTAISPTALFKMALHAAKGGNIEIMGMLVGKIYGNTIIVTDVYAIPVEGTETRVNAQLEGYEYMVLYLQLNRQLHPQENIVGWYHSHPGYGCWLSGIDVSTQRLNQIQDPYLAIVIDPIKSSKQGKVEIGAFSTLPESDPQTLTPELRAAFGNHAHEYYSLDIDIYVTKSDEELIKYINKETWVNELVTNPEVQETNEVSKIEVISDICEVINNITRGTNEKIQARTSSKLLNFQFNRMYLNQIKQQRKGMDKYESRDRHSSPPSGSTTSLAGADEMLEDDSGEGYDDDDTSNDDSSIYMRTKKIKRKITVNKDVSQLEAYSEMMSQAEVHGMIVGDVQRKLFRQ